VASIFHRKVEEVSGRRWGVEVIEEKHVLQ
jgi:hypothetical protein